MGDMTIGGELAASPLFAFMDELADAARVIALEHFRLPIDIERKQDTSPVTIADRGIEQDLRRRIAARFPDHGIVGEEFGARPGERWTWYLDPIDGTKSFISGMPLFGTLIALADAAENPLAGMIDMPALGERWRGSRETGTTFNGRPARVSGQRTLAEATVYTSSPDIFDPVNWARYDRVSAACAFRRYGGDCYLYGLLASGHCDLVIEQSLQSYDLMALVPVVEGAGGVITDWQGKPLNARSDGRVVAAASSALHDAALRLLDT